MRSGETLPLPIFKNRCGFGGTQTEVLSLDLLLHLPEGRNSSWAQAYVRAGVHAVGPLNRTPIRLPVCSALVSLDKLTCTSSDLLETAQVWGVELIVDVRQPQAAHQGLQFYRSPLLRAFFELQELRQPNHEVRTIAPPTPEEIEYAVRPLAALIPNVAKRVGLDFTVDLLPFLPALLMFVKRHPKGPHVLMLGRLARLLTNDRVFSQTLTEPCGKCIGARFLPADVVGSL